MKHVRRQRGQVLRVATMGIEYPRETEKGHDLVANFGSAVEPVVVKQRPEGKNRVRVGIVRQHQPVALGEIEAFGNQYQCLFTGGEGSNASLLVIEVVQFLLDVDERLALRGAVEKNRSRSVFARFLRGYRKSPLRPHRHR